MSLVSPLTNTLNTAVKKAANALIRDFSELEKLQSSIKDYKTFVVNSFGKIDRAVKNELSKVKPDVPFWESGKPRPSTPHFVVCPLNGLSNFAHGNPCFAVSVAVCDGANIIAGVIYSPITDELYFAEKGKGAYKEGSRNSERLRVSARTELKDALVSTLVSYKKDIKEYQDIQNIISSATDNIRVTGAVSMDLAYVAAGKLDATVCLNNKFEEIAAGLLIVKEAGGYAYDINQKNINSGSLDDIISSGNILAVNANLNKKLYDLLNK